MQPAQLEEFIVKCELAEWQKDELRASTNMTEYYRDNIYWHRLQGAQNALRAANVTLSKSGIFIRPEIKTNLDDLLDLAWRAISEDEINHQHNPQPRLREDIAKLNSQGDKIRAELEQQIRERLYAPE